MDDARKKILGFPRWELLNITTEQGRGLANPTKYLVRTKVRYMHIHLGDILQGIDQMIRGALPHD